MSSKYLLHGKYMNASGGGCLVLVKRCLQKAQHCLTGFQQFCQYDNVLNLKKLTAKCEWEVLAVETYASFFPSGPACGKTMLEIF